MFASADYAAMLRVWPGVRAQFGQQAAIAETDLLNFFARTIPSFSAVMWQLGREALLRNHLLHTTLDGHYSLQASGKPQVFVPVIEPAWQVLWQQVSEQLVFRPRCLWATHWLQPVLPGLPAVLGLEVNWSEVPAAVRLLDRLGTFQPVTRLEAASLTPAANTPPLLLVQSWPRWAPGQLVRSVQGIPTARLEKLVVDVPTVLPDFPLSPAAWLTRARHFYRLDAELVATYQVYRQQLAAKWTRAAN